MSKKPAATLSASLVAVKGTAAPASDMTGRASPLPPPAVAAAVPAEARLVPAQAIQGDIGGQPLNFRVPEAFRRDFKVYAATHGLKLNELLRLSFEAYRRQGEE